MENNQEADSFVDVSFLKKLIVAIGEVSEITGVPTRKIRYWEEKGIITSDHDGEGTTRRFDYINIKKIILINELLKEGFTLDAAARKVKNQIQQLNAEFQKLENHS
ncbi:MerR family transcriptional regulator [Oceanobacillus luteolus]|uniref:MerR family transcriptional regulator n=1 Tax=Oceanobacillus luteolus TaxID=1274358 RepID=A0ABW4HUN7_9BACI|nr:MerR family transcriptional regulator [Oceanobacillus luteolus]MCM3741988.1 MerR family transcriptional regulator [Oceanobacillus luteolus]